MHEFKPVALENSEVKNPLINNDERVLRIFGLSKLQSKRKSESVQFNSHAAVQHRQIRP